MLDLMALKLVCGQEIKVQCFESCGVWSTNLFSNRIPLSEQQTRFFHSKRILRISEGALSKQRTLLKVYLELCEILGAKCPSTLGIGR